MDTTTAIDTEQVTETASATTAEPTVTMPVSELAALVASMVASEMAKLASTSMVHMAASTPTMAPNGMGVPASANKRPSALIGVSTRSSGSGYTYQPGMLPEDMARGRVKVRNAHGTGYWGLIELDGFTPNATGVKEYWSGMGRNNRHQQVTSAIVQPPAASAYAVNHVKVFLMLEPIAIAQGPSAYMDLITQCAPEVIDALVTSGHKMPSFGTSETEGN